MNTTKDSQENLLNSSQSSDGLDNIEIEENTLADLKLHDEQGNPLI